MTSIPLSIVVATTAPWPAARDCLLRSCPVAEAVGAEVIVVGGSRYIMAREFVQRCDNIRGVKVPDAVVAMTKGQDPGAHPLQISRKDSVILAAC